ncbi:DinB family protein [Seonamhaeicola maritimus]|uniref:DinB family protein n=1 Tax=Seonamhaeicola maritimus TaxID=2591822 RepID=A0A5C7GID6_9FLAO|nr:DinB family protein [Seonamhaeicola maritimus]TXG37374.1 DinB family protein [Seonamhaeicola maritimus]
MKLVEIINKLEQNQSVFKALLEGKKESEYLWRPQPNKWNLLEIVCHLVDEEILDFRARTKNTIERPSILPPPIDPEGWVKKHNYDSKDYSKTLEDFLHERKKSIGWLKTQIEGNWSNSYEHPQLGKLSAKQFLNNWLAHDYLHIRQINRYHYEYFKTNADTSLMYAGDW